MPIWIILNRLYRSAATKRFWKTPLYPMISPRQRNGLKLPCRNRINCVVVRNAIATEKGNIDFEPRRAVCIRLRWMAHLQQRSAEKEKKPKSGARKETERASETNLAQFECAYGSGSEIDPVNCVSIDVQLFTGCQSGRKLARGVARWFKLRETALRRPDLIATGEALKRMRIRKTCKTRNKKQKNKKNGERLCVRISGNQYQVTINWR